MTPKLTAAELVAVGHAMHRILGRHPARSDVRGANKKALELALGAPIPSEATLAKPFGSWGEYLRACGWQPGVGTPELSKIERAAVDHCVTTLGITEESADRSITDGWYADGRTVEIKGSVLRQHKTSDRHFFGFRLHSRDLSVSADELILVGLDKALEPVMRIHIPKAAMPSVTDGRSNATVYASSLWGGADSKYRRYVRWIKPGSLPLVEREWSAGKSGDEK